MINNSLLTSETLQSLRDHFLIAMPSIHDNLFSHSVTYICEHTEQGAMGIVINQTLPLTLADVFKQLELTDHKSIGALPVIAGGPVQMDRGFILHESSQSYQSTLKVSEHIYLSTSRDIIDAIACGEGPENYLIALGYAGWSKNQLEQEILDNAWLILPADPLILFNTPLEERWLAAARPLGIDLNLISSIAGHG